MYYFVYYFSVCRRWMLCWVRTRCFRGNSTVRRKISDYRTAHWWLNSPRWVWVFVCSSDTVEASYHYCSLNIITFFSQLCTQIEQLEQENQCLKKEGGAASASSPPPNPASSPVDGELLRLQAENSTLQKKMKGEVMFKRCRSLQFYFNS